jgi:RNA polymerase sigma-70 factor (sigma-E family)
VDEVAKRRAGSPSAAPVATSAIRPADAFDAFVAAHGSRLLRTAYLLTGEHTFAEDVLRDTLVRAWSRWSRVSAADEPLGYVRRMLVRASVSRWRALRPRREDERLVAGPPDRATTDADHPDEQLWQLVTTLPPRQRAVVVLAYHEDRSDGQVADALGTTTGTVTSQRAKALRTLRSPPRDGLTMTDLETGVRDGLAARAEDAGPWRVVGARLRRRADQRRSARRRAVATVATTVAALGLAGALLSGGPDSPDQDRPPVEPTVTLLPDVDLEPEPSWTSVQLTDGMVRRAVVAALGGTGMELLVSTRLPASGQVLVVLGEDTPDGWVRVVTVTFDSTDPGARLRRGTSARYPSYGSLVAQPAVDGDGAALVVLVPSTVGDTVEVTSSEPGQPSVRTSGFLRDRLAIVPIGAPDAVTRLRILHRGAPRLDTVPAGSLLGSDVPRNLAWVVASTGAQRPHRPVQVRTNGRSACRMTVAGWWPQGQVVVDWNPVDAACAEVNGSLQLLPGDRSTSLAGVAPPRARAVRLHWAGGAASVVPTEGGDVNAFVGPVRRPVNTLVRAEAVDATGEVVATATP